MTNVQKVPSEVVLGFDAYYKEGVVESHMENERIHKVTINFYLVDDTIYIVEKSTNSGIHSGPTLKRQRVKKSDGSFINAQDFNVGENVLIYGRVYRVVSCDDTTRRYLTDVIGYDVPAPLDFPEDQYDTYRNTKVNPSKKSRTYEDQDLRLTLEQQSKGRVITHYPGDVQRVKRYLQDSDKVLRFYAAWDDRDQPHGDIRTFELRYYIQDDSIVVAERLPANSGRDSSKVFCSRRRCPKPEFQCKANDLTFSHRVNGINSEYHGEADEKVFYGLRDLYVGGTINVFGRDLLLYDADEFTRGFYKTAVGVELGEPMEPPQKEARAPVKAVIPPYNGYGNEEDSTASCGSLLLKNPKRDTTKWAAMDGKILRFKLKFHDPAIAEDRMREFVLSFHLADDTITLTECAVPNTGFMGGKILRQKVKKYDGEGPQTYYGPGDFIIGQPILINSMLFDVVSMDKFTEEYYSLGQTLERKVDIKVADIKALLTRLKSAVDAKFITTTEAFRRWDTDHNGYITFQELSEVISTLNLNLREEEIAVLMAQFDTHEEGRFSFQQFMAVMNGDTVDAPVSNTMMKSSIPKLVQKCKIQSDAKDAATLKLQSLRLLKEKLAERKLNGFEMFRMIATIPAGTNGTSSSYITPPQLRCALQDVLDLKLPREAQECIVSYFFPNIPSGMGDRDVTKSNDLRVDLATFHRYLVELGNIRQLPTK
eukprot:PhF_6_TR2223/c1_g1_i1/m.3720